MRKYLYIGLGGFLGALLRYTIRNGRLTGNNAGLPVKTLIVNITGCFLLAFILTAAFDFFKMHPDIRLGLSTGLLGAYTTFSTVCKETVQLLQSGLYLTSFVYISMSVILGMVAAYGGFTLARALNGIIKNKIKAEKATVGDTGKEVE